MPGIDSLTRATKALCAQSLDDVQVDRHLKMSDNGLIWREVYKVSVRVDVF